MKSDRDTLYKQVTGFDSRQVTSLSVTCDSVGLPEFCKNYTDPSTGLNYKFYYPDDDMTQYLYETYPQNISPIDGVTDEHFIVWMKTPMMPTFRKLYGIISNDFSSGDQLVVNVTANFEVGSFNGQKFLVVSTLGSFGGKNNFIGQAYISIGSIGLAFGIVALIASQTTLLNKWKSR